MSNASKLEASVKACIAKSVADMPGGYVAVEFEKGFAWLPAHLANDPNATAALSAERGLGSFVEVRPSVS